MRSGAPDKQAMGKFAVDVSAEVTPNTTGLFTRRPRLPLVPPPYAGESLSGWVQVVADAYGLNWRDFLRALDLPAPGRLQSLSIEPPRRWLRMLADQIGIDEVAIRDRMTLGQLSRDMAELVHVATPCQACPADIPPGRSRPIEWLADLAPWTLTCDRHPRAILAGEVSDHQHLYADRRRQAAVEPVACSGAVQSQQAIPTGSTTGRRVRRARASGQRPVEVARQRRTARQRRVRGGGRAVSDRPRCGLATLVTQQQGRLRLVRLARACDSRRGLLAPHALPGRRPSVRPAGRAVRPAADRNDQPDVGLRPVVVRSDRRGISACTKVEMQQATKVREARCRCVAGRTMPPHAPLIRSAVERISEAVPVR